MISKRVSCTLGGCLLGIGLAGIKVAGAEPSIC